LVAKLTGKASALIALLDFPALISPAAKVVHPKSDGLFWVIC
jgi:hypothetical protein